MKDLVGADEQGGWYSKGGVRLRLGIRETAT